MRYEDDTQLYELLLESRSCKMVDHLLVAALATIQQKIYFVAERNKNT